MEEDSKVLKDGTGAPYLAIFNGEGEPIIDPLSKLPVGMLVTDFEYIYEEDKEDSGQVVITTDNTDLISIDEFRHKMPLRLQWGWIFADATSYIGPERKVMITDHHIQFTPEGTEITLKFSDPSLLLKQQPPVAFQEANDFEGYVTDLLKGNMSIMVSTYESKPIVHKSVAMREPNATDNQRSK